MQCLDCTVSYVDKRKRELVVRVGEHRRNSKKQQLNTPIYRHSSSTGNHFEFGKNKTKILDIEPKYYRRIISEMIKGMRYPRKL